MELAHAVGRYTGPVAVVAVGAAVVGWFVHLGVEGLGALVGVEPADAWDRLADAIGANPAALRLVLFGGTELVLASTVPARRLWGRLEKRTRAWRKGVRKVTVPREVRAAVGAGSTVVALAMGVGLVVQPTLVPLRIDGSAWLERAANVADGTASAGMVDAAVWLVRWLHPTPTPPQAPVRPEDFGADLDAAVIPLMDRWDDELLAATGGDPVWFAQTKAVIWVESGGRQFALSSTGCAGLMQFCASTAQERPLYSIFGVGQVAACGCDDCSVPRALQVALETDPTASDPPPDGFPRLLSDARFDATKSIQAGATWIRHLDDQLGGNLPLVYVAYNSGPVVARSLYQTLGQRSDVTIADLRPHLADALRPHYGSHAAGRAQGLLDVHLPKLMAAYARWSKGVTP